MERGWDGITFNDGHETDDGVTTTTIRHAVIERSTGFGVNYRGYAPSISHVSFRNNRFGVYIWYAGAPVSLTQSQFIENDTAILGVASPKVILSGNVFWNNRGMFHIAGNPNRSQEWEIRNNDFLTGPRSELSDFKIEGGRGFTVNAQQNWWETTDATRIEQRILDELGRSGESSCPLGSPVGLAEHLMEPGSDTTSHESNTYSVTRR